MFRRRRAGSSTGSEPEPATAGPEPTPEPEGDPAAAAEDPAAGPFDVSDVADPAAGGRIDLGGVWLPTRPGMELRVEMDQKTRAVTSVAAVLGQAALQVQAFAAPRREGIWDDIRTEIAEGITRQGGRTEEAAGSFGTELRARIPARRPDGTVGAQPVRFLGVDGPRWFLRGVLSGAAAVDEAAAAPLEEIFRGVVVVRGSEAMAPREPIALRLPPQAAAPPAEPPAGDTDPLDPFQRGPEITEVR